MRNITKHLLFALLVTTLFVQCKKDEPVATKPTIDEQLASDPELSLFRAAIKQAKLDVYSTGPGPFTMLAPTNAAFASFGITEANLPSIDSIALTATLLYHVYNGDRTSFEFPVGPNAPLTTIAGPQNFSSVVNGVININGAPISTKDIVCKNGRLHKISNVLAPPNFSVINSLTFNSAFRLMAQAIAKVGGSTATAYNPASTAPVTVFGVSNSAFIAAGFDSTAIANATPANITTLSNILRYHVFNGRIFSSDLKAGNLRMVQGTNTLIALNGGMATIKGTNNAAALTFVATNLTCTNGIIHRISGMLLP